MTDFSPGAIVRVPFPYTDRTVRQHRPAMVVSQGGLGDGGALLWVLMVTSAENRRWPGDVSLEDGYAAMGLPAPSLVRTAKIMSIEVRDAELKGAVPPNKLIEVRAMMGNHLGWSRA
ncbi:MAG: type II toxin-antitoxin system PemK/MazF family toxin [Sphingomonadaceae bacterium]|nr:type II toxin-antitoxin system PemK/MazF family toxin [Sphingomonadaceae bacterium]